MEVIVTSGKHGGVDVTIPAPRGLRHLMCGATGNWHPWHGQIAYFRPVQFARMVARGVPAAVAFRYCKAMACGGLNRRQAVELIRDIKFKPEDQPEIMDVSELPTNRDYRKAWRRSHNGGPIWIDEDKAREIDEARMWRDYETA